MNDSLNWLNEIRGERALAWVREQNADTTRRLEASPRFKDNYELATNVHLDSAATLPLAMPGTIHEGWLYDLLIDAAHPRGLLHRTRLSDLLSDSPRWEPLLDVTALAATEGRPLALALPLHCFGKRCLLRMEGASREQNRGLDLREFDVERREFVEGGFFGPTSVQSSVWRDADTLITSGGFGPGTLSRRDFAISLRVWQRGSRPTREIFRGDAEGSWGVTPFARPSTDGDPLLTVSSDDRDRGRSYVIETDGRVVATALPHRTAIIGQHAGQVIAYHGSTTDWEVSGQVVKSGSIIAIPRADITSASPTVRIVFEPRERESLPGSGLGITSSGLVAAINENVRGRLACFTFDGNQWIRRDVPLPDHGAIILKASDAAGPVAIVQYESFIQPPTLYAVDVARADARPLLAMKPQFDTSSIGVEQHEAVSTDGTRVPYFVVRDRRLRLDGSAPLLLYGYGALGNPKAPHYDPALGRLWLTRGGVFAMANVRGGGEFGPAWHVRRMERQHTYEDFIAVAEDLIGRRYTSPKHLGIRGHSNGGLLVGNALNMRPELFGAAIIEHPVLDLHAHTRGVDSAEYGAWSNPRERAFLEKTSPLQNLTHRVPFPAPLLKTATDDTVLPSAARKYAAKLASMEMPYYFYESAGGRHNLWDTPQDAAYYDALLYTYLAEELE
jgi:prolyl oligopeptidase